MQSMPNDLAAVVVFLATWFSSLLGLPPEPRDEVLLRSAPADSLVYLEWAGRGQGVAGGTGWEGLVADPEIVGMVREADAALRRLLVDRLEGSEDANRLALAVPELLKAILVQPGSVSVRFDSKLVGPAVQQLREAGKEIPPEHQGIAGIVATLILKLGEGTAGEELERHLANVLKVVTDGGLNGDKLDRATIPLKFPGQNLIFHRHESYLIVSSQAGGIEAAIEGLQGTDHGLSKQSRFQQGAERTAQTRMGSLFWIDTKGIQQTMSTSFGLPGVMANGVAALFGLERLESMTCTSGMEKGEIVTRNWTAISGAPTKVFALFSGAGIPREQFEHVPADADLVVGASLDPLKALSEFQKLAAAVDRREKFDEAVGEMQEFFDEVGIKLPDLLKPFEDHIVVYDSPASGGLFLSGLVGLVKVKDQEQARVLVEDVVRKIRERLPPFDDRSRGVEFSEGEFQGEKIYYLNQIMRGPSKLNPAFCLTKGQLILGLHPQSIKSHLRMQKDEKSPRFAGRLPSAEGEAGAAKGKLLMVRFLDVPRLGELLLPFLPYAGVEGAARWQLSGLDLTVLHLPSNRAIGPYLTGHFSTVTRTDGGILYEGRGTLPPQLVDTAIWLLPAFAAGILEELTYTDKPGASSLVEREERKAVLVP